MYGDYQTSYYSSNVIRQSVLMSYLWMALGLVLTGAVSFILYITGGFLQLCYTMPFLPLALCFAQIIIVFAFSAKMVRSSGAGTLKALFIVYALTLGVSLTSLFYSYDLGFIGVAFLVSALYFACLVFIGFTTKKDMTRFGTICMAGLLALIVSQLLLSLFGFGMTTRMYSIIGLLLFTGITVWDVQRLNRMMIMEDGNVIAREKIAIYFALELYLDFINIFMYILQLLGHGSSKD